MNQIRRWSMSLLFVIILLAVLVCFFPTLLSFSFCKPFIEKRLSHVLQGTVRFDQLHLSWFTSQHIEGFDYQSADGNYTFNFKSATCSASLFKYLITPHLQELSEPGITEIISPTLVVHQHLSSPSNAFHTPNFLFPFIQNLSIMNGTFVSKGSQETGSQETQLHHMNIQLQFQARSLSTLSLQGLSRTGKQEGRFDLHLIAGNSFVPQTLHLTFDQFPLAGIDTLLNQPGLFTSSFGPLLNAHLSLNTESSTPLLCFVANAEHLQVSCYAQLTNNTFSLTKPASATLTLTPSIFEYLHEKFSLKKALCMTRNASLQLALDSLTIPTLDFHNLSYQAKLTSSPLAFAWCNTSQPISIDTLSLTSSTKDLSQSIDVAIQTSFNYLLKTPSYFNAELQLSNLFTEPWASSLSHLNIDMVKFPVALIDMTLNADHFYGDLLGETLNVHVVPSRQMAKEYIIELSSARLQIPELRLLLSNGIALTHPAAMTYIPNRSWIAQHLDSEHIQFSKTGKLYGSLEALSYPLPTQNPHIAFTINSDDIALNSSLLSGLITLKNASVSIKSTENHHFDLTTSTTLLYFDEKMPERDLLGGPLKIQFATNFDLSNPQTLSLPRIEGSIHNNKTSISLIASLEEHFTKLSLLEPLAIQILPSAAEMTQWTGIHHPSLSYVFSPLTVSVLCSPLFLNRPLLEQLSLSADAKLARVDLVDKVFLRDFALTDCLIQGFLDGAKQAFHGALNSAIQFKGESPGSLSLNLSSSGYTSFASLKQKLNVSLNCKGMPSSLLDTLLEYKDAFHLLLGNTLEASVDFAHQGDLLDISAQAMSSQMALSGSFSLSEQVLKIGKPFACDLKLRSESFTALEQICGPSLHNFSLTEPALVHIAAKSLHWPLNQKNSLAPFSLKTFLAQITQHLSQSYFHVVAQADHLSIFSPTLQKTTSLQNCLLESTKETAASPLLFKLSSSITDQQTQANQGEVLSTMTLQSTKDYQGRPMLLSKLSATLKRFPTQLIDSLFEVMGFKTLPPSILLGQEINATLSTDLENLSGHIDCDISSTDSKGNLNAYLTDGVLKLYKPIQATLNITPKLAGFFLDKMNVSLTLAKNPLQLFISDQGFYFPLEPFDMSKVQIRQASANFGKILCDNRGNPMEIGGFFKLSQDKRHGLSLWFAPMDFSLSNGSLQIDRTEVLFNDAYQIAFWGKVDLIKNYVNMVLGLTEQSLRKALGIRGLPKSFVLQVPMTGPIDNVRVNTEVATTRIAFLVARSSGITDQAGLWGGIVNAMGDFANDQSTVPPAKPPFPWKEALSQYEAEEKQRSTAHIIH